MAKTNEKHTLSTGKAGNEARNGIQAMWSYLNRTTHTVVEAALKAAGLPTEDLPDPPEPEPALRAALKKLGQSKAKVFKRPGKGQGFTVSGFEFGEGMKLRLDGRAWVVKTIGDNLRFTNENDGPVTADIQPTLERVSAEYRAVRQEISSSQLSGYLTTICEKLHGVCRRDGGGVYWIPVSKAGEWERYSEVIAAATGTYVDNTDTFASGKGCIENVMRSLELEAKAFAEKLDADMKLALAGELGQDAMQTRREKLAVFLDKLTVFATEVSAPSRYAMNLVTTTQKNLGAMVVFTAGVAAGRDMTAPVLLELDDGPRVSPAVLAMHAAQEAATLSAGEIRIAQVAADVANDPEPVVEVKAPRPKLAVVAPPAAAPSRFNAQAAQAAAEAGERFLELD